MTFTFYPELPADAGWVEVLSGETPSHFNSTTYLVVQHEHERRSFKIVYEYHCSPFTEVFIKNGLLLVGYEEHFYLYDWETKVSLLILKLNGYFSQVYFDAIRFYVADAESLHCISFQGEVIWHAKSLGIDGVIVEEITNSKIYGTGEWDPPGGWREFVIEMETGKSLMGLSD